MKNDFFTLKKRFLMHPNDWNLALKMIKLFGFEEDRPEEGNVTRIIYYGNRHDLIPNICIEAKTGKRTLSDTIVLNSRKSYFLNLVHFDFLELQDVEETEFIDNMTIPHISVYLESRFGKMISPSFATECKSRYFHLGDIRIKADYNTSFFILNNQKRCKVDLTEKSVRITIETSYQQDNENLFEKTFSLIKESGGIETASKRKAGFDLIKTLFS